MTPDSEIAMRLISADELQHIPWKDFAGTQSYQSLRELAVAITTTKTQLAALKIEEAKYSEDMPPPSAVAQAHFAEENFAEDDVKSMLYNEDFYLRATQHRGEHLLQAALFYYSAAKNADYAAKNADYAAKYADYAAKLQATYDQWNGTADRNIKDLYKALQEKIKAENPKGQTAPSLLQLDAFYTMRLHEQDGQQLVIQTITNLGKDINQHECRLIRRDRPLYLLTEEQVDEYFNCLGDKRPVWFQAQPEWIQKYITLRLNESFPLQNLAQAKTDQTIRAQIRNIFGHAPANPRMLPGLPNFFASEFIYQRQNRDGVWETIRKQTSHRSSFPGLAVDFKDKDEQIRLIKQNLKQYIEAELSLRIQAYLELFGAPKEGAPIPITFLIQSLLSPHVLGDTMNVTGQDNNKRMVEYVRIALAELHADFGSVMMINNHPCQLAFLQINRPINQYRNKAALYDTYAFSHQDEKSLIERVAAVLKSAGKDPALIDELTQLANALFNDSKQVQRLIQSIRQKITADLPTDLKQLLNATVEYASTLADTSSEQLLNKQLHLAALEHMILHGIGGDILDFCKSGADRKGVEMDNSATLPADMILRGDHKPLSYIDAPPHSVFSCLRMEPNPEHPHYKYLRLFQTISGIVDAAHDHNSKVRALSNNGIDAETGIAYYGRKEWDNIIHPGLLKQLAGENKTDFEIRNTSLETSKKTAKYNKPGGGGTKRQDVNLSDKQLRHPSAVAASSMKDLGTATRHINTCAAKVSAFYRVDQAWLSAEESQQLQKRVGDEILLRRLGFSDQALTHDDFVMLLCQFEEFYEKGKAIAERVSPEFSARYQTHMNNLGRVIHVGRVEGGFAYLAPELHALINSEDFTIDKLTSEHLEHAPIPRSIRIALRAIEEFFIANPQEKAELAQWHLRDHDACIKPVYSTKLITYFEILYPNLIKALDAEFEMTAALDQSDAQQTLFRFILSSLDQKNELSAASHDAIKNKFLVGFLKQLARQQFPDSINDTAQSLRQLGDSKLNWRHYKFECYAGLMVVLIGIMEIVVAKQHGDNLGNEIPRAVGWYTLVPTVIVTGINFYLKQKHIKEYKALAEKHVLQVEPQSKLAKPEDLRSIRVEP